MMFFTSSIFLFEFFTLPFLDYEFLFAFFIGLILISISRGINYDKKGDSFRIYLTVCGIEFGSWHNRKGYNLKLKYDQRSTVKTYGAFHSYGSVQEFKLVLIGKNELSIKKFNEYKEAKNFTNEVSCFLDVPIIKNK